MTDKKWQPPGWATSNDRRWRRATLALRVPAAQLAEMNQTPEQVRQRLQRGETITIWDEDGQPAGQHVPYFVDGRYVRPVNVPDPRISSKRRR